jgi:hypothetical protein
MKYLTLPYCSDTPLLFERLRDLPQPVLLHSSDRAAASGAVVADSSVADELLEIEHKIGRLLQSVASLGASKSCSA